MDNNDFGKSLSNLSGGIIDSLANGTKAVLSGITNVVGDIPKTVNNGLAVVDSAISDVAIPTVDTLRNMGINTSKSLVKLGYDSVKEVGGAVIDGGKEAASELKGIMPKAKDANVTAPKSKAEQLRFIEDAKLDAIEQIKQADEARKRIESAS